MRHENFSCFRAAYSLENQMNFLVRWLVNAAGFYTAIAVVPGIMPLKSGLWGVVSISFVAGLINTIISPVFKFFTFPFVILTLGLWLWVANLIMFWFAGYLGRELGFGFTVSGFWATFFGALIVSLVSSIFGYFLIQKP